MLVLYLERDKSICHLYQSFCVRVSGTLVTIFSFTIIKWGSVMKGFARKLNLLKILVLTFIVTSYIYSACCIS